MNKVILLMILAFQYTNADHAYENECPAVSPMSDFDVEKFLGVWYQVQPNFDSDDDNEQDIPSCEFYNVTKGEQPNTFVVNTEFELYAQFDGDKPLKYSSISTNYLSALDENLPAMMQITPTIGEHIIESNFTIFSTDYESYAVISNCDKQISEGDVQFNQHATIWSRSRDLDENFVEKLYESMSWFDFDPYDLSSVSTTGCIEGGKKLITVNLDNDEVISN